MARVKMADTVAPSEDAVLDASERARLCQLIEESHDFVWRTLRRLGVRGADTDDATQQVFMVIFRKLRRIQPGKERSFLYGVTVRVARAHARRRWREAPTDEVELVDHKAQPDIQVDHARQLARLDELLGRLSFPLRTVFVLHEIEEMTLTDIATTLRIPRGTAASRLRRGREQLLRAAGRSQGKGKKP